MDKSAIGVWSKVAAAVARRPDLWSTAGRAVRSHAPERWWRTRPWLPIPDRRWMEFRMTTAYGTASPTAGSGSAAIQADEVIEWLEWLRSWHSDESA